MRYISTLLLSLILAATFACGGAGNKTKAPELSAIPWENISNPVERAYYEETANCPEATKLVEQAISWPLVEFDDGTENPQQIGEARFMALRAVSEQAMAIVQFRVGDAGVVIEGILVVIAGAEIVLLDYFVIKGIREGTIDVGMDNDVLFASATGKFFCAYLGN